MPLDYNRNQLKRKTDEGNEQMTTPDDVSKMSEQIARNEREHNRIWNAAIEAAAKRCEEEGIKSSYYADIVRSLKK